ncbi:hypothetical protein CBR_g5757 [Chara braunii]|uniref:Uncharacterized protein n=1 Tax=Chara braunii TaxID=69332 RepID=A0A388KJB8_CHABU|nr:hypothetical protein CBR_g5757 [Chara braunii]|eukprot:GBG70127.1 hypothetical protein CBR_g5757 [Chara braunii]
MGKSIRAKGKRRIRLLKREIASKVHFPKTEQAIQQALAAAAAAPPAEIPRLRGPNAATATGGAEQRRGRQGAPTAMAIEGGPSDATPATTPATIATEGASQTMKKRKKKGKSSKKQNMKHRKWMRTFGK